MVIAVSSAFEAELENEHSKPVILIALNFTTGFRRFALWPHDVSFGGNTFFGLGPVGDVESIEVNQDTPLTEQFLTFHVQNDPSFLEDLQQNSRGRFCTGRLVFLDDSNVPIESGEHIVLWHKRMVPGRIISDQSVYSCTVGLESRFHRHKNRAPRTYSEAEQLKRDPTDHAFSDAGKTLDFTRGRWRQKSGLG